MLGLGPVAEDAAVTDPLDLSMLAALARWSTEATAALESYDHTGALERTERFFWQFCDDYLEIVKTRAYGDNPDSARAALRRALGVMLRLFAPVLPYVTEEVWSWWQEGSVHRAAWPTVDELPEARAGDPALLTAVAAVLQQVRKAKSRRRSRCARRSTGLRCRVPRPAWSVGPRPTSRPPESLPSWCWARRRRTS